GQQVFGGHGYVREWGQEQLVRDVRIAQIYEGTNGIQALDLMGRKTVANNGAFVNVFIQEVRDFISENSDQALAEFVEPLAKAIDNLEELTGVVIDRSKTNANEIGAASVEYLHVFGYTAYAYMWARMAKAANARLNDDSDGFYQAKIGTGRFFVKRLLPRIHSLSESVRAGSESLYELDAAQF
ncbi:MAG: acyl-CoA dehydrogenase, partial [Pseudomonas sp.]|nr:acyl-CoA dehydrogenase [Pseudomonas sp.]